MKVAYAPRLPDGWWHEHKMRRTWFFGWLHVPWCCVCQRYFTGERGIRRSSSSPLGDVGWHEICGHCVDKKTDNGQTYRERLLRTRSFLIHEEDRDESNQEMICE